MASRTNATRVNNMANLFADSEMPGGRDSHCILPVTMNSMLRSYEGEGRVMESAMRLWLLRLKRRKAVEQL